MMLACMYAMKFRCSIEHDFQMYLADGHFLLIMICSELKFLLLVH
jgi:hypothetical protein